MTDWNIVINFAQMAKVGKHAHLRYSTGCVKIEKGMKKMSRHRSMERYTHRQELKKLKPSDIQKLKVGYDQNEYSKERADRLQIEVRRLRNAFAEIKQLYESMLYSAISEQVEREGYIKLPRETSPQTNLEAYDVLIEADGYMIKKKVTPVADAIEGVGNEAMDTEGSTGAGSVDNVVQLDRNEVPTTEAPLPHPKRRKPKQSGGGEPEAAGSEIGCA